MENHSAMQVSWGLAVGLVSQMQPSTSRLFGRRDVVQRQIGEPGARSLCFGHGGHLAVDETWP
jgi:hypothetical protein